MVRGMKHFLYEGKLRTLGLFSLEKGKLCRDLTAAFQYLNRTHREGTEGLDRSCSARTRRKGYKLKEGTFRLNIRKKFLTLWVVRHWNGLPR